MSISALKAHFVEDYRDVFLLKIVELSVVEMADSKGVSNGGDEHRVPVNKGTCC